MYYHNILKPEQTGNSQYKTYVLPELFLNTSQGRTVERFTNKTNTPLEQIHYSKLLSSKNVFWGKTQ